MASHLPMTTPDLLTTVGFQKGKIGSGEKDIGYQIKEGNLCSLLGSTILCFTVMGFMVISMVYDVHLEKKTFRKEMRQEEHHAAGKLAQVQMELWSQYRDDVQESHEASRLLKKLEAGYGDFEGKFKSAVTDFSAELNFNPDKAAKFADKILHLVADMQGDNVKHAKHLLDHLVKSGKQGEKLEKHVEKEIIKEVKEEERHLKDDKKDGIPAGALKMDPAMDGANGTDGGDPLKVTLEGFWYIFNDYEKEFSGKVLENFRNGHPVLTQLQTLYAKISGENPPSEEEVAEELDKIDLVGVGAGLGAGRVLPVDDIVEELVLLPKVPHEELVALEKAWRAGDKDSVTVFSQLQEWHQAGVVPTGWLQMGVNNQEKEETVHE